MVKLQLIVKILLSSTFSSSSQVCY